MRTTTEVLHDHLEKRLAGDVEADIATNYASDVILLANTGNYHGHDGVRSSAADLADNIDSDSVFEYSRTQIADRFAYLEWTATGKDRVVRDGVDSFVVENGKIVFQSIRYTVQPSNKHG